MIIEVLDARDPMAYRSLEVERYVRAAGSDKKIILLLNKIGEDAGLLFVRRQPDCLLGSGTYSSLIFR